MLGSDTDPDPQLCINHTPLWQRIGKNAFNAGRPLLFDPQKLMNQSDATLYEPSHSIRARK